MPQYASQVLVHTTQNGLEQVLVDPIQAGSFKAAEQVALAEVKNKFADLENAVIVRTSRIKDGQPVDSSMLSTSTALTVVEPVSKQKAEEQKPVEQKPASAVAPANKWAKTLTYMPDPFTNAVIEAARRKW